MLIIFSFSVVTVKGAVKPFLPSMVLYSIEFEDFKVLTKLPEVDSFSVGRSKGELTFLYHL